jgi:hypothetical protein
VPPVWGGWCAHADAPPRVWGRWYAHMPLPHRSEIICPVRLMPAFPPPPWFGKLKQSYKRSCSSTGDYGEAHMAWIGIIVRVRVRQDQEPCMLHAQAANGAPLKYSVS